MISGAEDTSSNSRVEVAVVRSEAPPPRLRAPDGTDLRQMVRALAQGLRRGGYTIDGIAETIGEAASAALEREQPVPAERATRGLVTPAAVLTRLFGLGRAVPAAAVEEALPAVGVAGLLKLGLIRRGGDDEVAAVVDLRPYQAGEQHWYVVSDVPELAHGGPLPPDHVLGIGGASVTLAQWSPRPHVDRALDLGTGSGVQALHLTAHAGQVVATDLSRRAVEFARFTAALNDVEFDLRTGSLTEPVRDETFDLIVSNPPFVITPRREGVPRYEYRDGGVMGDGITSGLIGDVAALLRPGGIAQMLGNWELVGEEDWTDRVRPWLTQAGVDGWVIQREVQDPAQYAETWARDGGHLPGTLEHDRLYDAWLDDFADRGVTGIGFGIITLHRPTTAREPWVSLDEVRGPVETPMGPRILAGLQARSWLAQARDDDVLDIAWRTAEDVTAEHYFARPGDVDPTVVLICQGGGLRRAVRVDSATAGLLGVCDGELTARQGLAGIAVLTDVDQGELRRQVVPVVRDLVADGLLVGHEAR